MVFQCFFPVGILPFIFQFLSLSLYFIFRNAQLLSVVGEKTKPKRLGSRIEEKQHELRAWSKTEGVLQFLLCQHLLCSAHGIDWSTHLYVVWQTEAVVIWKGTNRRWVSVSKRVKWFPSCLLMADTSHSLSNGAAILRSHLAMENTVSC